MASLTLSCATLLSSANSPQHLVVSGKCSCVRPSSTVCSRAFPDASAELRRAGSLSSSPAPFLSTTALHARRQSFFGGSKHLPSGDRSASASVHMNYSPHGLGINSESYDDEEYLEAHIMDAVRMAPSGPRLYMTMSDGSEVEVEHVNPNAGRLLYPHSTPAIFVKIAGTNGLLLPIVVGELAVGFLMKAFRKEPGARPSHYDVMRDMVESLKYEVRMVKITQRVMDTYYARIYLAEPDSPHCVASVDARPSDAINLAVRAMVPIFVSKSIVRSDGVRVMDEAHRLVTPGQSYTSHVQRNMLGRGGSSALIDPLAQEMALTRTLMVAVQEERYGDAALIRDQLNSLRKGNPRQLNNKF